MVALRLVECVRVAEVAIFTRIFGKIVVELVPQNLPDEGSHCWLESFPHPETFFASLTSSSDRNTEHILLSLKAARSRTTAAGQRATADEVRLNPTSDATVLLHPAPGEISQAGFEERRRCPTACVQPEHAGRRRLEQRIWRANPGSSSLLSFYLCVPCNGYRGGATRWREIASAGMNSQDGGGFLRAALLFSSSVRLNDYDSRSSQRELFYSELVLNK
jgi:hypothetical protein